MLIMAESLYNWPSRRYCPPHTTGIMAESLYASGDPGTLVRGIVGDAPHLHPVPYVTSLGWTTPMILFTGNSAASRGIEIARIGDRAGDKSLKVMGQVQRVRGWSEMICGLSFIPVRFSQTIKKIDATAFKIFYKLGIVFVVVLYVLMAIPFIYRLYLHHKIKKQIDQIKDDAGKLEAYKKELKVDVNELDLTKESDFKLTKDIIGGNFEKVCAHFGVSDADRVNIQVRASVAEKTPAYVLARFVEMKEYKRTRLSHAIGEDAVKAIEGAEGARASELVKKITKEGNWHFAMLVTALVICVVAAGVYGYMFNMGGAAMIQSISMTAVAAVMLVVDGYYYIQSLKHDQLTKEKHLTMALTTLLAIGVLLLAFSHGHHSILGEALVGGVVGIWMMQMFAMYLIAWYKSKARESAARR